MNKAINQLIEERDARIIKVFGSFEAFNEFRKENPNVSPFTLSEKIESCPEDCGCLGNGDSDYHWNFDAWK